MAIQATNWTAQLNDGTKFTGGRGYETDYNVSAIPLDQMRAFTVLHNDFSHTYHVPGKTWYKDGKVWPAPGYPYPTVYTLKDGSTLTVDFDTATGRLKLTQV